MAQVGVSGRMLEVGAGRGHFLRALHKRFPWLELSAHENATEALEALRNLDFLDAVYEGELAPDGRLGHAGFHAIVCSEVLEHIEEDGAALSAMCAILRPGGRLFLTVPLRDALWTQVDDAVGHFRRYSRGQLAGMCRDRDLEIEVDMAVGFPFYNTYYRMLGTRSPQEAARSLKESSATRLFSHLATALFRAESHFSSPLGGRGVVVARKSLPRDSRGR